MAFSTTDDPSAHFQQAYYSGNGGTQSITNTGNSNLQPDWLWIKQRNSTNGHKLDNSRRGAGEFLSTNTQDAEGTDSNGVQSFLTDGFSLGSSGSYNGGSGTYSAWQWKAGGPAPTQTYRVVVVSDSGNKYRFRNSGNTATFNASAVTVDLQEGGTYTFDVSDSSVSSHPFVIGTSANSNEYSTGVVYKLDGVTKTYSQYTSGFSAATSRQLIITVAASAPTLYYWCSVHSGMGGQINTNSNFGSTNFDGSLKTTVTANQSAGFSIMQFTSGNGDFSYGHGLGQKPRAFIIKDVAAGSTNWRVFIQGSQRGSSYANLQAGGKLNSDAAFDQGANAMWNGGTYTDTTDSVLYLGTGADTGGGTNVKIMFVFAEKQGFSKFGNYQGTGNADGNYIYCGFKPQWVMVKKSYGGTHSWQIQYSGGNPTSDGTTGGNPIAKTLLANTNAVEATENSMDFCSTGFKIRTTGNGHNTNDHYYSYMAFAKQPLVATNDVIATAY